MIFHATLFPEAWLIEPTVIADERGWFMRTFCRQTFAERGLISDFVQANHSQCVHAGTLRGLHYQVAPFSEVKLVRCVFGTVFDVIVDMRRNSSTFLRWHGETLSAANRRMLYVPAGFAHGYQALEAGSEVAYQASCNYAPASEQRLRFDEPRVGIEWPIKMPILSPKDEATPFLSGDFKGVEL
jgi:dTDP-4-dehydrorhamnose 3,5-epimerase